MKIKLIAIAKTDSRYLSEGIEIYVKRLKHYVNFKLQVIPDVKNSKNRSQNEIKDMEGEAILKTIDSSAQVVLLDEKGRKFRSVEFSTFIEKKMIAGTRELIFVIGGPYGFSEEVKKRGNALISLSDMTFSHQMVRLIFVEQLYRAFTIMKGEPYHHE